MPTIKITELPSITGATAANADVIPIVDVSATTTSKITRAELFTNAPATTISGNLTVDTNTLFVDASTNRVGINTTTPTDSLHVVETAASTNTVLPILRLDRQTSGTPAAGIGASVEFAVETAAGNTEVGAAIEAVTTDVTANSEDFDLVFKTMNNGGVVSESMRLTSNNRLLLGTVTDYSDGFFIPSLQVSGEGPATSRIGHFIWSANANAPSTVYAKSRGTSGVHTVVSVDDNLGQILFRGSDGANFINGALIAAQVDGTPSTNDMPTRLVFSTTADGASSVTERMRITNAGNIGVGVTAPITSLDVVGDTTTRGVVYSNQPAPDVITGAATLTIANLLKGIVRYTGAAANLTLPTVTDIEGVGGVPASFPTSMSFDVSIVNTGTGAATLLTNTGLTLLGSMVVTNGTSGMFRFRKTGATTYTVFRIC